MLWTYALGAGDDEFVWVHLQSDLPESIQWLHENGIDEVIVDTLTVSETRPRTFPHQDGMLLVMRGVNKNPTADPEDLVSLRVWFTKKLVITARKQERKLHSIEDLRGSIDGGNAPTTSGEFVCMLVARMNNRIGEVVDNIDESLTQFETNISEKSLSVARRELSESRRDTASIRRYLAPQRDALDNLVRSKNIISDQEAFVLRNETDRLTRYVEDLELARERTLLLQEELQNRVAEQQNSRMYVLSIVTAIFLPLSFLTGVFGMNVGGLPGLDDPGAFAKLAMSMAVLALVLLVVMRWRRWL